MSEYDLFGAQANNTVPSTAWTDEQTNFHADRWIVKLACRHFNVKPSQTLIVGDRLETDIRMAHMHKMRSVLVTTGVTKASAVAASRYKPDLVIDSVAQLTDQHHLAHLARIKSDP